MSLADVQEALRLIAENPDQGFFAGARDEALITSAELALGSRFSPTYRMFIQKLGAGDFKAFEIYGVVDDDFEDSTVPNGVWLTLSERRENGLPSELVVIGSTGDGEYYCIEQLDGEESPVFIYRNGIPNGNREIVAEDFGKFLLDGIRDQM